MKPLKVLWTLYTIPTLLGFGHLDASVVQDHRSSYGQLCHLFKITDHLTKHEQLWQLVKITDHIMDRFGICSRAPITSRSTDSFGIWSRTSHRAQRALVVVQDHRSPHWARTQLWQLVKITFASELLLATSSASLCIWTILLHIWTTLLHGKSAFNCIFLIFEIFFPAWAIL